MSVSVYVEICAFVGQAACVCVCVVGVDMVIYRTVICSSPFKITLPIMNILTSSHPASQFSPQFVFYE